MVFDKNGADMLVPVECYICTRPMYANRKTYHSSTCHWQYKCKSGHIWWIGEKEIAEHAIR